MKTKNLNVKSNKNKIKVSKETEISFDKESPKISKDQNFKNRIKEVSFDDRKKEKPVKIKKVKKTRVMSKQRKRLFIGTIITIAILLTTVSYLLIQYVVLPMRRINHSVNVIKENSEGLLTDFNNKDLTKIDSRFNNIQVEIDNIDNEINRYEFLKNYGATKGYYENLQVGKSVLAKTDALIEKTLPELKDALASSGFTVEEGQVIDSETDTSSLNLVMQELPQYLDLYNRTEPDIIDIFLEVKKINPEFLPDLGDYKLKDKYAKAVEFIDDYPENSEKTLSLIENFPKLLGSTESSKYLVILQNETEMRSSGGLLTAFGILDVSNGEVSDIDMEDMWNLQYDLWGLAEQGYIYQMPHKNIYGQAWMMNGGYDGKSTCGATEARAQDVGLYSDLYVTADWITDYYDLAHRFISAKYPDYDYVLIINYAFTADLVKLVEPLQVEGLGEVYADNLYDVIKSQTDDPTLAGDPNRKSVIGEIGKAVKEKIETMPISDFPKVAEIFIRAFQAKDVSLASFKDESMQAYFDKYGFTARTVNDFDGDYFQLGEAQNCSLKLNRWVRNSVQQVIKVADDGGISKEVFVHWTQPQIYSDAFDGQYSANTSFSYRAWVRVFMPEGSYNIDSDGYKQSGYLYYRPQNYYDSIMDKRVSDNIIQFDHRRFKESDSIDKKDLNVFYNLPDSINYKVDGEYKMLVQKHPGKSWGENYKIIIREGGMEYTTEFVLDRDKVVTYSNGVIIIDNYDKKLDWLLSTANKIPFEKISNE